MINNLLVIRIKVSSIPKLYREHPTDDIDDNDDLEDDRHLPKHDCRVPTRTGKPGKWEGIYFPVREKSENFQQTGKRRKKTKILEKSGKFRQMLFIIVS